MAQPQLGLDGRIEQQADLGMERASPQAWRALTDDSTHARTAQISTRSCGSVRGSWATELWHHQEATF